MSISGVVIIFTLAVAAAAPVLTDKDQFTKVCGGKPAEIFFLLDSSSSIWSLDFRKQLTFVNDVIDIFEVSPNKTRVGVGSFSYYYHENIALDTFENKEDVQTAVLNIKQYFGGTNTYDALDGVRTRGLGSSVVRPGVVRIAIVLTDGESFNPRKTREAAKKLKDDGVVVFVIGIGNKRNKRFRRELEIIASEPTDKFLFEVGNYGLLQTIKEKLAMKACEVEVEMQDAPIVDHGPSCGLQNPADVMFLVDPTELGPSRTDHIYDFISDVTADFNMKEGNIRIGVESRNCGTGNINLSDYIQKDELTTVLKLTKQPGMGHMVKRLRTHAYKEENGGRIAARRMAVIFVDDKLHKPKEVLDEAKRSKQHDVEIFVVAIGDRYDEDQVKSLCSSSADRHIIRVPSYDKLNNFKSTFLQQFCPGL